MLSPRFSSHNLLSLLIGVLIAVLILIILLAVYNLAFLNSNSGAFTVVFSGVVAISTVVYAVLTAFLVSETRRMREAHTEPDMSISLQQRGRLGDTLFLVIQNIGLGEALEVKFGVKFTPETDFTILSPVPKYRNRLQDLNIIKNGLSHVAPNQRYSFFLAPTRLVENTKNFEITVNCQNSAHLSLPEKTYLIDFSTFCGIIPAEEVREATATT